MTMEITDAAAIAAFGSALTAIGTAVAARFRSRATSAEADAKITVARVEHERENDRSAWTRLSEIEKKVDECEDERAADRIRYDSERTADRAAHAAETTKLRKRIDALQEEIFASKKFKRAVRDETREEVRKCQSDPGRATYGADDSLDSGQTDMHDIEDLKQTQVMRPLQVPPPPRRR